MPKGSVGIEFLNLNVPEWKTQVKDLAKYFVDSFAVTEKASAVAADRISKVRKKANADDVKDVQISEQKKQQVREASGVKEVQSVTSKQELIKNAISRRATFEQEIEGKKVKALEKLITESTRQYDIHQAAMRDATDKRIKAELRAEMNADQERTKILRARRNELEGSAGKSLMGSVQTGVGGVLQGAGIGLAAGGAAAVIGYGLKESVELAANFETALIHLSNTTGITGSALDSLGEKLRKTALKYNVDLPDAIAASENLLRSLGTEFKNNAEAANSATESIFILAKAQGITADEAAHTLTETLHSFGLASGDANVQADNLARIMNVLAAAATQGTARMPELQESMKAASVQAHEMGLSVEDTAAAIEVLSKNGIEGSEAGGKFALFLTKISGSTPEVEKGLKRIGLTYDDVNPEKVGLNKSLEILHDHLNKVGNPVNRMEILTQVFGAGARGGAKIAEVLLNDADAFEKTKEKITGTSAASDQANKVLQTTAELFKHDQDEAKDLALSLGQNLLPMLNSMLSVANDLAKDFRFLFNPSGVNAENQANFTKKNLDQTRALIAADVAHNKDKNNKNKIDRNTIFSDAFEIRTGGNALSWTPAEVSATADQVNKMIDEVMAEAAKKKTDGTKDNNFGNAPAKKSKKDLAQEAFDAEKAANNLIHEQRVNDAYERFFTLDHDEKAWQASRDAADAEERKNNIQAVRNYYIALGITDKTKLDAAVKNDKDYQAIIRAGNEAKDKLWQEELALRKKYIDTAISLMYQQLDKEIAFRKAEFDARNNDKAKGQAESDKKVLLIQKAHQDELDAEQKQAEELLSIVSSPAAKAMNTWEDQFFKPMEENAAKTNDVMQSMFIDIGKTALKYLANKAAENIADSIFNPKDAKDVKDDKAKTDHPTPVDYDKIRNALGKNQTIETAAISITTASLIINGVIADKGGLNASQIGLPDIYAPGKGVGSNNAGIHVNGAHPWMEIPDATTASQEAQWEQKQKREKEQMEKDIAARKPDDSSIGEARIPGSVSNSMDLDYTQQNKDYWKQLGLQSVDMAKFAMTSSMSLGMMANLGGTAALEAAPSLMHTLPHLAQHGALHAGVEVAGNAIENVPDTLPGDTKNSDGTVTTAAVSTGTEKGLINAAKILQGGSGKKDVGSSIIGAGEAALNIAVPGLGSVLGALGGIFGFKDGGEYDPTKPRLVGEEGPEIDYLGTIIPLGKRKSRPSLSSHLADLAGRSAYSGGSAAHSSLQSNGLQNLHNEVRGLRDDIRNGSASVRQVQLGLGASTLRHSTSKY